MKSFVQLALDWWEPARQTPTVAAPFATHTLTLNDQMHLATETARAWRCGAVTCRTEVISTGAEWVVRVAALSKAAAVQLKCFEPMPLEAELCPCEVADSPKGIDEALAQRWATARRKLKAAIGSARRPLQRMR